MAARLAGTVRTAGRIEFVRDQGPVRRNIRIEGVKWDPDVHRNLSKILWAAERSHNYAMAALRLFSKMPSSKFSPDGLLGGVGYIQQVKDMRENLSKAVEVLSSFCDTVDDEVNAEHWKVAIEEDPTTTEIIDSAAEARQNPEQLVEQQFQQENPQAEEGFYNTEDLNPSPDDFNPFSQQSEDESDDDSGLDWGASHTSSEIPLPGPKSALPTDDSEQAEALTESELVMNTMGQASTGSRYEPAIRRALGKMTPKTAGRRTADSSVDPATLPGPRVMHIGPGASPEEFGYFSDSWDLPSDDPLGEGLTSIFPIYEPDFDPSATGYSDPTDGDITVFRSSAERVAAEAGTYSWLPGSRNEKPMSYAPGLSAEETQWLRDHDAPDPPADWAQRKAEPSATDPLWQSLWEQDGLISAL